jgi:hypothetical protein
VPETERFENKLRTRQWDCHEEKNWWQDPELNRGHKDFQFSALPTELSCQPGAHIELGFAPIGKTGIQ